MPKPPSPMVLVTSNSPSRVPASSVSAWLGPPVVGDAVVGIELGPDVGIDVAAGRAAAIVCVGAAGGIALRRRIRRCRASRRASGNAARFAVRREGE
jgi:hypothetical protein